MALAQQKIFTEGTHILSIGNNHSYFLDLRLSTLSSDIIQKVVYKSI